MELGGQPRGAWILIVMAAGVAAACGTSTTTPSSSAGAPSSAASASAAATPTPTSASIDVSACPPATEIASGLGLASVTLTATQGGPGSTPSSTSSWPAGATGIGCTYTSAGTTATSNVVELILGSGVPSGYIVTQEDKLNGTAAGALHFSSLSGVGDQAVTYSYPVEGRVDEGVIAQQGGNFAGIAAVLVTSNLSGIESLVRQLL